MRYYFRRAGYLLLDGHVRFSAMRDQGSSEARCLIASDDEAFTYNKRVNRLATIQEHYMIVRALDRGVSEEKLARALNVDVGVIRQRRDLLNGISADVAELLKDKPVGMHTFQKLRKMKPIRQLEVAELMVSANNYSVNYAKALLATTKSVDLHHPEDLKKATGLSTEQMARLEREMASVSHDYKELEASYGDDMLLLVIAAGFLEATPAAAPAGSVALTAAWLSGPNELRDLVDTTPTDVSLQFATLENDQAAFVALIERRRRCTELAMVVVENEVTLDRVQSLVDAIWAGMRPFPYTASEIARAVTALARFDVFFRHFNLLAGRGTFELAAAHLDDPLEIEMGLFGAGSTRCCVSSERLVAALTESGREALGLPYNATAGLLKAALIEAQGVRMGFFDENRFRTLMVDEIIPWQVISRRNPTIYAASQIEVLGIP